MKTVIQHAETALYWTAQVIWTDNPRQALVFLDEPRAMDYAFYHDIHRARAAVIKRKRPAHKPTAPAGTTTLHPV